MKFWKIWQGGMSFMAACFGVTFGMVLFARRQDTAILYVSDRVAMALIIPSLAGIEFHQCRIIWPRDRSLPWRNDLS